MSIAGADIGSLPHALRDGESLKMRTAEKKLAVFLDYDGTLTPIVDRPEDAVISERMRVVVQGLARRCPVCVVSGRDRAVLQRLMRVDDLVVAGSHGFDIWSPGGGGIEREEGRAFEELLARVTERVRQEVSVVEGALVEKKRSSVAVHYRLVDKHEHSRIQAVVDSVLSANLDTLRVTPGKMVYEIQPKLDWDKGKAVLHLIEALGLDREDVLPLYLGDDITDEDAFRSLSASGIAVLVADPDDPEVARRSTAADYVLANPSEVEVFLEGLGR